MVVLSLYQATVVRAEEVNILTRINVVRSTEMTVIQLIFGNEGNASNSVEIKLTEWTN